MYQYFISITQIFAQILIIFQKKNWKLQKNQYFLNSVLKPLLRLRITAGETSRIQGGRWGLQGMCVSSLGKASFILIHIFEKCMPNYGLQTPLELALRHLENPGSATIGESKGAPGTRPTPGGPNSFIFMQFLANN